VRIFLANVIDASLRGSRVPDGRYVIDVGDIQQPVASTSCSAGVRVADRAEATTGKDGARTAASGSIGGGRIIAADVADRYG
jgi:hypothetical protein